MLNNSNSQSHINRGKSAFQRYADASDSEHVSNTIGTGSSNKDAPAVRQRHLSQANSNSNSTSGVRLPRVDIPVSGLHLLVSEGHCSELNRDLDLEFDGALSKGQPSLVKKTNKRPIDQLSCSSSSSSSSKGKRHKPVRANRSPTRFYTRRPKKSRRKLSVNQKSNIFNSPNRATPISPIFSQSESARETPRPTDDLCEPVSDREKELIDHPDAGFESMGEVGKEDGEVGKDFDHSEPELIAEELDNKDILENRDRTDKGSRPEVGEDNSSEVDRHYNLISAGASLWGVNVGKRKEKLVNLSKEVRTEQEVKTKESEAYGRRLVMELEHSEDEKGIDDIDEWETEYELAELIKGIEAEPQ